MTEILTMSYLYDKLSRLGLNEDYVRNNGLPSWWDDSLNDKHEAVLEGAGYIADNLNVDLKSLLTVKEEIKFNPSPPTKFKRRSSQNNITLSVGQALCSRLAELIAYGTEANFTSLPTNVTEIRAEILTNYTTVNLISLLDYCWSKGIVIAYFNRFPETVPKFTGFIQLQSSCPVIILSSTHKGEAELAFDLAHELGHLAHLHLEQKSVLIDEHIQFDSNEDDEENKASQFATKLLLGDCDNYNFAHENVENLGSAVDSQQIINKYLADKLDWDKFSDESYEYLEKALGV
jgi:IrrE N-terminal-like domain